MGSIKLKEACMQSSSTIEASRVWVHFFKHKNSAGWYTGSPYRFGSMAGEATPGYLENPQNNAIPA